MMSKSNKKVFVILFTCLLFILAVYFNLSFIPTVCAEEVRSVLQGNISVSNLMAIVSSTASGYYEELMKEKGELTEPARIDMFIETYGLTQSVFRNNYIYSKIPGQTVFKTSDDRLVLEKLHSVYDYSDQMRSLKSFSQWVNDKGIDFFVTHAPTKEVADDEYPLGMSQEKNSNDCIVESLQKNEIPCIDFRKNPKISTDSSEWHYRTDHHWTTKTAFLSAQYLVEELNRVCDYGLDESVLNTENFNRELHENVFLGSAGQKTGSLYAGKDDFELYLPKFSDTDFYVEITHSETEIEKREGTFEQALIFKEHIDNSYYEDSSYSTYLDADHSMTKIVNNNTDSDKRIVVIKDSYANAMVPYLAMVTKEIVMIDPRWYRDSMKDYIEKYKPDAVILVYNPGAYLEEVFFNFD